MAADAAAGRAVRLAIAAALLSLAGCDPAVAPAPADTGAAVPESMSYEVAIAIAAADRNHAIRECDARPEAERETCRTVARANWDTARAAADGLRGDQP